MVLPFARHDDKIYEAVERRMRSVMRASNS